MSGQRLRLKGYSEGERLRDLALAKLLSVMTFFLSRRRVVCTAQLPFLFSHGAHRFCRVMHRSSPESNYSKETLASIAVEKTRKVMTDTSSPSEHKLLRRSAGNGLLVLRPQNFDTRR